MLLYGKISKMRLHKPARIGEWADMAEAEVVHSQNATTGFPPKTEFRKADFREMLCQAPPVMNIYMCYPC